ncbi:ATP-binding cassette domain-containing protein [Allokutzneria albata]|uniref:ABC-2 type transport system ATP-binding protein n=1 Tax=Allokutzneria albata TaxID=211114 RepID=A0A1H0A8W1_ALLAB|nr:ABC transporter ATP-binding protein [Allokutzneria albata]SDN29837.1 ABC-2 type transport system ATP-binding protein [Allokutzneria albata]
MTETAIATTNLGRQYGAKWALRDCTLRIPAGRVVGVVGPAGAGKSTLMNMMVGLLHPSEGELEVLGERVGPTSVLERVAHIAEEDALCRNFKVTDLLTAARLFNARWTQRIAEDRLRERGISLDSKVGELSCGQRAQIALTVALATTPELLILDAPVTRLDPLARKETVSALLAAQAETGCTVVVSAREVTELEQLCDHLVLLDRGELRLAGDTAELVRRHQLGLDELVARHLAQPVG